MLIHSCADEDVEGVGRVGHGSTGPGCIGPVGVVDSGVVLVKLLLESAKSALVLLVDGTTVGSYTVWVLLVLDVLLLELLSSLVDGSICLSFESKLSIVFMSAFPHAFQ